MSLACGVYAYIALMFTIFLIVAVIRKGPSSLVLTPSLLGGAFFAFIHGVMPAMQVNVNFYRYDSFYTANTQLLSAIIVTCGGVAYFAAMNYFYKPQFDGISFGVLTPTGTRNYMVISLLTFAVAVYCSQQNIRLILSMGIEAYLRDRIALGFGRGFTVILSHWTYVSCLLFFIGIYITQPRSFARTLCRLLFLVALSYTFLYYTLNSNRNSLFILLVNLVSMWFLFNRDMFGPVNVRQLSRLARPALGIAAVGMVLFFVGQLRHGRGDVNEDYSMTEFFNGAFGNHENVLWLLSNDYDVQMGTTYLAGLTNFVPRAIWADKPTGAGPVLKNMIMPGSYVVGDENNSSYTTGLFPEIMMNSGSYLFIPICIVAGILVGVLFNVLGKRHQTFCFILVFAQVSFSSQLLYAEFLGFFGRFVFSLIPFIGVALFVRIPFIDPAVVMHDEPGRPAENPFYSERLKRSV